MGWPVYTRVWVLVLPVLNGGRICILLGLRTDVYELIIV